MPAAPTTVSVNPIGNYCGQLADSGWAMQSCGTANGQSAVAWTIEARGTGFNSETRSVVWQQQGAGSFTTELVLQSDKTSDVGALTEMTQDVQGDGTQQLAFFTRGSDSGGQMWLDLISLTSIPFVSLHIGPLDTGTAHLGLTQIDAWGRTPGNANEAHCCWTDVVHDVYRYNGEWIRTSESTTTGSVPQGTGFLPPE
jgi:hypothetical protein